MSAVKLDNRDLQILAILCEEGRISKSRLAERVNLSLTPCWERLKRLEKAGIIRRYRADVSLRRVAAHIEIFVAIELDNHKAQTFEAFERHVANDPEVEACWALGGGFDYFMKVIAKDIEAYQAYMDRLLGDGVHIARYFTYVVTKPVKEPGTPPFDLLVKT